MGAAAGTSRRAFRRSRFTMTTTGAVMMALAWLMLGRFALGPRRMSRSQPDRTLLLWMVPLLVAPPMYSKDVYSYVAQSQIARMGLNPYKVGPALAGAGSRIHPVRAQSVAGDSVPLRAAVPMDRPGHLSSPVKTSSRRALPSPGRPDRGGDDRGRRRDWRAAAGCRGQRAMAGAANPLLLMHLVAGIHNEALMMGLMLTGFEVAPARDRQHSSAGACRCAGPTPAPTGRRGPRWA